MPIELRPYFSKNTTFKPTFKNPLPLNKKWDFNWVFKSGICRKLWTNSGEFQAVKRWRTNLKINKSTQDPS